MVRASSKSGEACARCGKNEIVTDNTTGERFCSKCGFVVSEKSQESGPEWRAFTQDESGNRARTGAEQEFQRHSLCTIWVWPQLSIQSTKMLLENR